jgi:hypothetical protein
MMRSIAILVLLALGGCATKSVLPREYLDEQTAATITVVADPWIFTRKDAPPQLDFFNLYAIDVNRMGDHRKYFAVVHYWPSAELSANGSAPKLVLTAGAQEFEFAATSASPREVGLAQPLDKSAPSSAQTWLYPVNQEILRSIAQTRQLDARLVSDKANALYAVWRDGSTELSEFATAFDR